MTWSVLPAMAIAASLAAGPLAAPAGATTLGYTPVLAPEAAPASPWQARERPALRSYELAVLLNYGAPFAVASLGGLVAAPFYGNATASGVVAAGLGTLTVASFAAGYVYAGDPMRGALVSAGELGVLTAALLVSGGVTVLLFGGGQGAGIVLPLIGTPIIGATWIACQVWKLGDLREVVDRTNAKILAGG